MFKAAKKCLFYYLRPILNTKKLQKFIYCNNVDLKIGQKYPQDDRIDRKLENISFLQVFLFLEQKFRERKCKFIVLI